MDVKESFRRLFPTVLVGCIVSASAPCSWADDALPPASASKATPAKDINLKVDPGLFGDRLKLPSKNIDVPMGPPPQSDGIPTRKDLLRMRDRREEKQNWMFVEPGQLTEDREKREEDNVLKDRWELKEDMKKKGWWEYSSKSDKTAPGAAGLTGRPSGDRSEKAQMQAELRMRLQQKESDDKDGFDRGRSGSGGSETGRSRESAESPHQSSALNLKDLFTAGSDGKGSRTSDSGGGGSAWELFPSEGNNRGDRETQTSAQSRRQEFRDFLNLSSTTGKSSGSGGDSTLAAGNAGSGASPLSSSLFGSTPASATAAGSTIDWLGVGTSSQAASASLPAKDFQSPGDLSRAATPGFNSGFSGFTDGNRSSAGGFGAGLQSSVSSYRSSYDSGASARPLITPQMMTPPKRRF